MARTGVIVTDLAIQELLGGQLSADKTQWVVKGISK
jgi:hypothetical protein